MGRAATIAALLAGFVALATSTSDHHEKFVPLVAFECGYRNRYMSDNGSWVTDDDKYASCVSGKYDILKYCKKVYPSLNVTNIVEYNHEVTLADWCLEEGSHCESTKTVRPFRCIVGEFHSEALQVPHDCRFNHENSRDTCNDYNHWKNEASTLCSTKTDGKGKKMVVRSFSMLEPCGLDLFTGVEYVCCPRDEDVEKALISKHDDENEIKKEVDEDDDDDDDDDDDESYEDDDESTDDKKKDDGKSRDEYFVSAVKDLAIEHEKYREALDRMEQKHRTKINQVMKEWNELDARYNKQKNSDPVKAELFKKEMANRFQTTVAALEEEHRKMRKEIEDVHEERVQSTMNEKKRSATHSYREALAESVGSPNKHKILKTLKAYIRSEEKDRIHALNRFRHLLRTDTQEAMNIKSMTVHRLRYIDLRINGTIAMLSDFPSLEAQIRPIAMTFWSDFRRENTPEMTTSLWEKFEKSHDLDEQLVDYYESEFRKSHPEAFIRVKVPQYTKGVPSAHSDRAPTTAIPATSEPAKVLPKDEDGTDSEEDDDSYYEDENDEEMKKTGEKGGKKSVKEDLIKVKINKVELESKNEEKELEKKPIVRPAPIVAIDNDDDSEDDSDEDDDDDEKEIGQKELRVDIEPIIEEHKEMHVVPAYYHNDKASQRVVRGGFFPFTASGYVFLFVAVAFASFVLFALIGMRNRRRHIRFVEVDVCSPEERHVNGMQVNGYENPTYSFFDSKA